MHNRRFDIYIRSEKDLTDAIEEFGFVPYFMNSAEGFSIEEHVSSEVWFSGSGDGVWEWKGPVIRKTGCAYGKFFENKAVFISRKWFPDFANYRRDGYDFDARNDEGLVPYREKTLFDLVEGNAPIMSKRLKIVGEYGKNGRKGFDTMIVKLQAQCYVLIDDFLYETDRNGNRYGWGVAEYSTPEIFMGAEFTDRVYRRTPEESYELIADHLRTILPHPDENAIARLLR